LVRFAFWSGALPGFLCYSALIVPKSSRRDEKI
jgi:hypothetical protein